MKDGSVGRRQVWIRGSVLKLGCRILFESNKNNNYLHDPFGPSHWYSICLGSCLAQLNSSLTRVTLFVLYRYICEFLNFS